MPKEAKIDDDTLQLGLAVARLREAKGFTQEAAAANAEPRMTSQYWGMHENGRVPGIHKPAVLRKLLAAIEATPEELEAQLAGVGDGRPVARLNRIARELAPAPGGGERSQDPNALEAVFPTRDGPVVFRYPGNLTPEGFKDLEAYFAVFLRTNAKAS